MSDTRQSGLAQEKGGPRRDPQGRRPSPVPAAPGLRRGRLYSPDLNPIEQLFAKLKHLMRKAEERTHPAAWRRVGALLDLVSSTECANYLANSGYAAA
jgi:transposase